MAGKKQGRAKVQEEGLAAQLAEMNGDLSEKDLKEILRSARYVRIKTKNQQNQHVCSCSGLVGFLSNVLVFVFVVQKPICCHGN